MVDPPAGWQPSAAFLDALLAGLSDNPALEPVTVAQLIDQVPAGGNREPVGPPSAGRRGGRRHHKERRPCASPTTASSCPRSPPRSTGHPAPELTHAGRPAARDRGPGLSSARRNGALNAYARAFGAATGQITLATERTVTFTARQADIPITVLSAAPYPVTSSSP